MIIKKTITSIFMVPTLKISNKTLYENKFINAYCDDMDKDIDYEDAIFLLFKPENLVVFKEFLDNEYERTKHIVEDYDYEGGYVVVVYKLDEKYKKDFNLIRQGKYSKTSLQFQELFPEKITIPSQLEKGEQLSLQHMIFHRDKKLLEFWEDIIDTSCLSYLNLEVWSGFNLITETLDINHIKNEHNKTNIRR